MRRRGWSVLILGLVVGAGGAAGVGLGLKGQSPEEYPHDEHAGLFPLCTGCHEGVPTGDREAFYPEPELCVRCHDGVDEERVVWTGASSPVNNLRFTHPEHAAELARSGEPRLDCAACHAEPGGPRGAVARHPVESCLSCHAHQAESHYGDADCSTCHVPLAGTRFASRRIADLPRPDDHDQPGFLARAHGRLSGEEPASCATCHTRERCTSCHVVATEAEIRRLPEAPSSMELPPFTADYPVPASHEDPAFLEAHGQAARAGDGADCATCHTRDDCASCHLAPAPPAVGALPTRSEVRAPGVGIRVEAPRSHASPWFVESHEALAAANGASCATCHSETFCTQCHDGPEGTDFHPENFMASHASAAYSQRLECSTCHSAEAFCRQCHQESGFGSSGRLGPGFHDAEPVWLLRHPQAARQNLESCQSCHTQRDCLQCHSALGSFRVSPHGPDFDARRAWERNPTICFACHITAPLEGGGP